MCFFKKKKEEPTPTPATPNNEPVTDPYGGIPVSQVPGGMVGSEMPGGALPGDIGMAAPGGRIAGGEMPGGALPGGIGMSAPGGRVAGGEMPGGALRGGIGMAAQGGRMVGGEMPGGQMPGGIGAVVPGGNIGVDDGRSTRSMTCGGYRSHEYTTSPVTLPTDSVKSFFISFAGRDEINHSVTFKEGTFYYHTGIQGKYEPFNFEKTFTEKELEEFDQVLRECKFNEMNGHDVFVYGLPPMGTCRATAEYSGGVTYAFNFNGMHAPAGFMEAWEKLQAYARKISEFSPEKCPRRKPVIHFLEGESVFEIKEGDEVVETVQFHIDHTFWRGENCEVTTKGKLGNYHIRAHVEEVCGGYTRFDVRKLGYYDDTPETIPEESDGLVSILKDWAGNVTMEIWRLFAGAKVNEKYPRTSYVPRVPTEDD